MLNPKTASIASTLLLCAAAMSTAQAAPLFQENFNGLSNGTDLTTSSSGFNYVRSNNGVIQITEAGSKTPLLIQSVKAGNSTQGIGVNLPQSSSVFSISFNMKINELTGGTSFRFALGSSSGSYYPGGSGALPSRLDQFPSAAWETFASESAFILNMGGNGNAENSFGKLQNLNSAGTAWSAASDQTFLSGTTYNLHFVANGSTDAIILDGDTINAGHVAVYVDGAFMASFEMANNVTPDSFRIYTHGRSAGGGWQASAQFGEFAIWDHAVAPIPEASTLAFALIPLCLLAFRLTRRKAQN